MEVCCSSEAEHDLRRSMVNTCAVDLDVERGGGFYIYEAGGTMVGTGGVHKKKDYGRRRWAGSDQSSGLLP